MQNDNINKIKFKNYYTLLAIAIIKQILIHPIIEIL